MAGGYTAIDLSQLPAPDVVETLDFETIFAAMLADLQARDSSFTALVESDPVYKLMEVAAYRELIIRQRVNEACRAMMLAYSTGADLENLAGLFGVTRLVLDEGDPDAVPPVDPTYESDADFRKRITLSLEGFSTAGPSGAYIYHALSADGTVRDASATSPEPGEVLVCILSSEGDGTASEELISTVEAALTAEDVRPLCDNVVVQSAEIVPYSIEATLHFYSGPDSATVLASAQAAAEAYALDQHRLGRDITISGIYAALHQSGVQRVDLVNPAANVVIDETQASWCTAITLTNGGADE